MGYFDEVYKARLNRNGATPTERLNHGREANFEKFLYQSPHYVEFYADTDVNQEVPIECVFEPSTQSANKSLMHVLCRVSQTFKPGDIYTIAGERYMFWYWDERKDSGYNRWTVVRISRKIEWVNNDGSEHSSEVYMYGQLNTALQNVLQSSRNQTVYLENNKLEYIIMPVHKGVEIGSYFHVEVEGIGKSYRVTGYDHVTTPGIMYVTVDPTYERDLSAAPEQKEEDNSEDFFWLGGVTNG